jgi:hypothetical protein
MVLSPCGKPLHVCPKPWSTDCGCGQNFLNPWTVIMVLSPCGKPLHVCPKPWSTDCGCGLLFEISNLKLRFKISKNIGRTVSRTQAA